MYRMVTPPKGKYVGVPLNPAGRRVADAWDPAKDEAAGEACKAYGAGGVMRLPGRIHITWQDDNTMKLETEAGQQARLFYFGAPPAAPMPTWQGVSQASWEQAAVKRGDPRAGNLKVVTNNLRAGYLRKNGVPYSENVSLTEYWEVFTRDNGEQWLTITTIIEDPRYLRQTRLIAIPFKKEADQSKWDPTPCSARW
jgi:hypothetical protein